MTLVLGYLCDLGVRSPERSAGVEEEKETKDGSQASRNILG